MKVKANSVKQEYEKQDELKRSAMRAVAALLTISDAGTTKPLESWQILEYLVLGSIRYLAFSRWETAKLYKIFLHIRHIRTYVGGVEGYFGMVNYCSFTVGQHSND